MKKNLKAESSSNDNYLTNVKETLCGFAARHIGLSADDINHMPVSYTHLTLPTT